MLIPILLLVLGFVALIKGGDWFVDGATGIARRFHLPELLIGATVVSIGTTLPEVMVSAGAAFQGSGSLAYGNAIGSIICNTALIAAITIAVKPAPASGKTLLFPVGFFGGAMALFAVGSYVLGEFPRWMGIVLLALFVVYIGITVYRIKRTPVSAPSAQKEEPDEQPKGHLMMDVVLLVIGAALIAVGADLLVDNATVIAQKCGMSEKVIGLTIVALGTSLPELVTAITSLIKGHGSLSLGNIVGANLFNLILVSGAAITINPFALPVSGTLAGINTALIIDLPVAVGVMLILTLPVIFRNKLARWQGISLLVIYASFLVLQFMI